MNSFHQSTLSFTGQNMGAGKYDRVKRILIICLLSVTATGLTMGLTARLFGRQLLSIYSTETAVIDYGMKRMNIIFPTYFLCGTMEVVVGSLRGMGYSVMPMTVSLLGACGLRIVWIMTIFSAYHTPGVLYTSYPVSWLVTFCIHLLCFAFIARKRLVTVC